VARTGGDWQESANDRSSRPYLWTGPSAHARHFFYDAPVSRAIAFEGLLQSGEALATRLLGAFHDERTWPQLVHCATDGESYGHHSRFGDMALAAPDTSRPRGPRLTNHAAFLAMSPRPRGGTARTPRGAAPRRRALAGRLRLPTTRARGRTGGRCAIPDWLAAEVDAF
jgi:hypothetical protein